MTPEEQLRLSTYLSQQDWQASQQRREPVEDTRTHQEETKVGHGGSPSIDEQSKTHGAPLPAQDRG